jgi:hypothetical protein
MSKIIGGKYRRCFATACSSMDGGAAAPAAGPVAPSCCCHATGHRSTAHSAQPAHSCCEKKLLCLLIVMLD